MLKCSITDRFHECLFGNTFEIYKGNKLLMYILTFANFDPIGDRWEASLANYNFSIFHEYGRKNIEVDVLSRIPSDKTITADTVQAVIKSLVWVQSCNKSLWA